MIVIKNIDELSDYEELIRGLNISNYQQTYENIYSIYLSNDSAISFLDKDMFTILTKRDDNIYECPLNIEPIINSNNSSKELLEFINNIKEYLGKTIYFSLIYEDSNFYKLLNNDLYTYDRLYTSICDYSKIANILDRVLSSERVHYSNRNVKKFNNNLYIKYYSNMDPTDIIVSIEKDSWKNIAKQDMINKKEQLLYYSSLVKLGIANIAVSYMKDSNDIVSYRLETIYNNKVHVLKNSFKEKYKKYSPGSYMLISDLYDNYKDYNYVDLYGGPGLVKDMIETRRVNRYDMLIGEEDIIKDLEVRRKRWDLKNYSNFLNDKSIKDIFNKKENILAVTSCFGLGPVGKLSAIVEASKNDFNWYASGEEFDINIFNDKNIFIDKCFTMDKEILKEFLDKYNIKYALVVLKNKMARLLLELGIKVIYVDSLPFMWSMEDANSGKVPYNVDCYCAQKTIELSSMSKEIFSKVKNLVWVDPIVNKNNINLSNKKSNYILVNIGGLHSPSTNGYDYVDVVIKNLIRIYKDYKIIITTSLKSSIYLKEDLKEYSNVDVKTLKQREFFKYINNAKLFITSPGLTTILESRNILDKVVFLPPQNISQFYNVEYGKKIFKYYKELTWNNNKLTIDGLNKYLELDEHGVIEVINNEISKMNNESEKETYMNYMKSILDSYYIENKDNDNITFNGVNEVIENIKKVMGE